MKIGDRVRFKRGFSHKSDYETGVIVDIDLSDYSQKYGNPIKVRPDIIGFGGRKKIALKEKSIILL